MPAPEPLPEPLPEHDDMALLDLLSDLDDGIAVAQSMNDLRIVGRNIVANKGWLGQSNYDQVVRKYQVRAREITTTP